MTEVEEIMASETIRVMPEILATLGSARISGLTSVCSPKTGPYIMREFCEDEKFGSVDC